MMKCPRCGSTHISYRETGMRTCATVGSLLGATSGINAALRGGQVGIVVAGSTGPLGLAAGGLTAALLAGLISGSAGCALGSLVGRVIDANFLDNRTCVDCGLTFRESAEVSSLNVQVMATAAPAGAAAAGATASAAGGPPLHSEDGFD